MDRTWSELRRYESIELVKREYEAQHGVDLETERARKITSYFVQARSYFQSSGSADDAVSPLLQYYGVLSLSRGVILMLERSHAETELSPSHGLKAKNWEDTLLVNNNDLSKLEISITKRGTFNELQKATGSRSLLPHTNIGVFHSIQCDSLMGNMTVRFGELTGVLPTLQRHNVDWQGHSLCCLYRIDSKDGITKLKIFKESHTAKVSKDSADRILENAEYNFVEETSSQIIYQSRDTEIRVPGLIDSSDMREQLGMWNLFLCAGFAGVHGPSKIALLFLSSYSLGMIVRYYPTLWIGLLRGAIPDSALPTLFELRRLIQKEFPQIALDYLKAYSSELEKKDIRAQHV